MTLWGLKQALESKLHISAYELQLIADAQELWQDNASCCAAGLGDADSLLLVRRPAASAALLERLLCKWWEFGNEPEEAHSDRDLALALVGHNGMFLEHLSPALRGDREVVRRAVVTVPESFAHASEELRADREYVLFLMQLVAGGDVEVEQLLVDPLAPFHAAREVLRWAAPLLREAVELRSAAGLGTPPGKRQKLLPAR
jgi:hypothetical protein